MPRILGHKKSYTPCRDRHLKCDRETPRCSACRKSRYWIDCTYEANALKFRTTVIPARDHSVTNDKESPEQELSPPESAPVPDRAAHTLSPHSPSLITPNEHSILHPEAPSTGPFSHSTGSPTTTSLAASLQPPLNRSLSCVPCPITDSTEARIFSFYLETAGPWLDIVSPNRFFRIHVSCMATTEPVLLSACLAYASHVLCLHGQISHQTNAELHDRALMQLTPIITSFRANQILEISLEPILATTVLLRMTEQFMELGEDRQHHLYGSSTLFETAHHEWSLYDCSLSSTSFWAYLRGSIRISFLLEQPCPFPLSHLSTWECASGDPTLTDEARTNLMTYPLAELCTGCWGEAASPNIDSSKLGRLERAVDEWRDHLPPTFLPWFVRENETDAFPDVRCTTSWHYVGWQFYYAAKVMLAVHSSDMRQNVNVLSLARFLEEKVVTPTRWLCGLTASSTDPGVKLNGSHLVAWSAQYLTGKAEQLKVLDMLSSLWEETKWPNITCQRRLKDLWNGTRRQWAEDGGDLIT